MQLGMVGLGRMGANIVRRLMRDGHDCVVYDVNEASIAELEAEGAVGARTLEEFAAKLDAPRAAWVMVPAAFTGQTVDDLAAAFDSGDIIIDGGNSYYRDDIERAKSVSAKGIHYVDCGTSGGVFGLERGYCLMIGGETETVAHLDPIFKTIAPGMGDEADRTPGLSGPPSAAENGYLHCGPHGAGHFVKMVHNGIEYGIMAAYAEGLNILNHADAGLHQREEDAETTPLRDPEYYQYGRVSDSGEGRWTVLAAVDVGAPAHILTSALYDRFESRGESDFADKLMSAMRKEFGGHDEKPS
ncbi:MAG: decarboxylating 6-phosphogluconate dehydrogenase [Solirubrobacterales bacterium]|nr:decarboxylating 6-phosphogluconate dehydrogenase [Solirubrobacterales bacterium]